MKTAINTFFKYYLERYHDFPREIPAKMRNLLLICIAGWLIFAFMVVRSLIYVWDPFELVAASYGLITISIVLILIRNKQPIHAGNAAICILFYAMINLVIRDAFSTDLKQISRISDTALEIIFGLLLATTFVIRKRQYIFAIVASYAIIFSHFFILVYHDFSGNFDSQNVIPFAESLLILTSSLFFVFRVLSLTTRERGEVFTNIVFYKLNKQGPAIIHSEFPLQEFDEISSGVYCYTAIGQGIQYSTGLFGPIPFGLKEAKKVALIYAARIKDTTLEDQRLSGLNYLLIALVSTPEKMVIIDRQRLESGLIQIIGEISDLAEINDEGFTRLIKKIRLI